MAFTLVAPCEYREEIRKSRFLALAAPVESAQQALAFIEQHRDAGASHNCWAFKCGAQYRFSDDGEPGGTAGRPILAAIEGQDCDRVAILVIRWYGGIQLGTGGLARAYGGSAAKCLQGGERVALVARVSARCHVPFAELARVKARLADWQALLEAEQFDADGAALQLSLPAEQLAPAARQLADLSRGQIHLQWD
ncbi:IMPACT family protein [Aquipseudomonas alcaligenes]|uniref:Thymidylate synthase n=1 Tax=Aquipseudomonas alcaligenes TaxID=43263 RepID=A0AA37FLY6_AQUAC|nr:YigZ family protein [Pseudomonas alcaligenes]BCR23644.1 thymidylate synthase [Pseudomonas alcaligenes]GIZ65095.1 thymidylate synthase [Pseudomonas alcaligenes]GIZ69580.1 thymidylate synthase [Pseudomonas alcaligenes]GIZ73932.1 thymidylate synthase [Pseudomonas alcaligenes]GIZ78293.1 thymidylate synthase [Pseudomonas alcaligenes]